MFSCNICGSDFSTVKLYLLHCQIHSNLPKVRLPCCFNNCFKTSCSITGLRMHLSRDHSQQNRFTRGKSHLACQSFQCSVTSCGALFTSGVNIIKHLRQHIRDGMKINCPIKGCNKQYHIASSLSCHLSRDHYQWSSSDLKCCTDLDPTEQSSNAQVTCANNVEAYSGEDDSLPESTNIFVGKFDFITNLSLFFQRLSTKQLIPDSTVDVIAHELHSISSLHHSYTQKNVQLALAACGASDNIIASAMSALDGSDLLAESLGSGGIL